MPAISRTNRLGAQPVTNVAQASDWIALASSGLASVDLSQIAMSVEQMSAMRGAMMHFAKQIAGKNDPAAVLREAIDKVRRDNSPFSR
jgi:hypothetical protein